MYEPLNTILAIFSESHNALVLLFVLVGLWIGFVITTLLEPAKRQCKEPPEPDKAVPFYFGAPPVDPNIGSLWLNEDKTFVYTEEGWFLHGVDQDPLS